MPTTRYVIASGLVHPNHNWSGARRQCGRSDSKVLHLRRRKVYVAIHSLYCLFQGHRTFLTYPTRTAEVVEAADLDSADILADCWLSDQFLTEQLKITQELS